jgi:hypothetical protein
VTTLAITPRERAVLRRELDWYQGALDDLVGCLKGGRSDLRLRWRAHIALSLLDDLGWQREDPRGEFHITLDAQEFAHWLRFTIEENDRYIDEQRGNLARSRRTRATSTATSSPPAAHHARSMRSSATVATRPAATSTRRSSCGSWRRTCSPDWKVRGDDRPSSDDRRADRGGAQRAPSRPGPPDGGRTPRVARGGACRG